jgi:hypothetical protein
MAPFSATYSGGSRRLDGAFWAVSAVCGAAALWLWFQTDPWPDTPDGLFHLHRSRALAEALRQGVLYPRWFPDFAFGYGYPVLNYYAPAYYYGPALLHLAGLTVVDGARLTLALCYGLSGLALYGALRTGLRAPAALAGALLYLAFPYRRYDLWVRGALPEFAAFVWPPLLLYFSILLLRPARRTAWLSLPALGLALSWAGLILTHNLTALMALMVTAAAVPLAAALPTLAHLGNNYANRLAQVALRLGTPALWGGLLSAFYGVPALWEAAWVGIGATPSAHGYAAHFAAWTDLNQSGLRYDYPAAAAATVPLPSYTLPLLLLGGVALLRPGRQRSALVLALAGALLALWLTTGSSSALWAAAAPVLGKLQFPWRWQTILALALAAVLALVVDQIITLLKHGFPTGVRVVAWGIAVAVGLAAFGYAAALPRTANTLAVTRAEMWAFDAAHGQVGATWAGEFLPRWVSAPRWTIGRAPEVAPPEPAPLALAALPVAAGYLDMTYQVQASTPLTLTFDRFYFPAWRIAVDGAAATPVPENPLGLLAAPLAAGKHEVAVSWRATPAVWVGRALTAVGWTLGLLALAQLGSRRRWLLGGWLAAGLIGLVGVTGISERTVTPHPVAADFGAMRLEAAVLDPAHGGAAASVRLFWTVTGATGELVAFVHVLGPEGAVIAQWDEPLGGVYRPASRQPPGLLMSQPFAVPLPADLPPGDYQVVAGLYPAGQPDAPLITAGASEPRVPVGLLRVKP